ncbi:hypothetical protein cce_5185 [Crocosphaera subtropica ATCC 51142]|uniref:Uncharacterized protein n=1 Tax=Crocosphaera subtropica (strain ATCC 51142 / BH68) TaxID=43989 RepID=B1X320_CROS5|nr:hypothetical protein [Crocosphaera subtropica]ACB54531.1 hypothetical protein cce_5185 [Crocosphaera subtropica ATCC 51142]
MKNTIAKRIFGSEKEERNKKSTSLDPLAENFDFEGWAKIVKKQMITSLNHSFSSSLSKHPNDEF